MVRGRCASSTSCMVWIIVYLPTKSDSTATPLAASRMILHLVLSMGLIRLSWVKYAPFADSSMRRLYMNGRGSVCMCSFWGCAVWLHAFTAAVWRNLSWHNDCASSLLQEMRVVASEQ